jgi:hypothetical protein
MTEPLSARDCARVVVLYLWPTKEQLPTTNLVRAECGKRSWKKRPSNRVIAIALAAIGYRPARPSNHR